MGLGRQLGVGKNGHRFFPLPLRASLDLLRIELWEGVVEQSDKGRFFCMNEQCEKFVCFHQRGLEANNYVLSYLFGGAQKERFF